MLKRRLKSDLTLATRIVKHVDITSCIIDGKAVLLNLNSGKYRAFTEVGSYIWNEIDKENTISGICNSVQQEFNVDYEQCLADLLHFVRILIDYKLVVTN